MRFLRIFIPALVLMLNSCGGDDDRIVYNITYYAPEYAGGFDIVGIEGYKSHVLRVKSLWQGADSTSMELFIAADGEKPPYGFRGQVINGNAEKLAVMSSSHIGMLSAVGAAGRIVAVSGLDFVNSPEVSARRDSIMEIGMDSSPDYEGLLAAGTDLVLIYGIASASPMEKKLQSLGIPYIYIGEYFETSPLGRAEWMVAMAEIAGCAEHGKDVFNGIAARYNAIKSSLEDVPSRPQVMLNAPYGDSWFMSPADGVMASLIYDAGGSYIYKGGAGNRSVPVDREEAFMLVSDADFWLDTGHISSMDQLRAELPSFCYAGCVAGGNVYNNDRRLGAGGGNDYWESAPAMPDVLLGDLARILHPELMDDSILYFYRRL
ncbi:MAG: ABC transporter substrate-binding protein [Bacteroidales bacterium]|nr:ABC transporter substrate-binding protein [Bacteroides sp.]MCM1198768.1 ABC transporter substrate-binding protein [Clostridium sp.]MCM1503027.1 ABC transporter substrate-binding protein [Bacteroidales bacterium]